MKVLSFGCGVQTTALAAMCCFGDIEMPNVAIMGDTGWERKATYEYMKWFVPWCAGRGLRIVTSSRGCIRTDALEPRHRFASMPLWTMSSSGRGMLRRQCTREYKITVVQKEIRRLAGLSPRQRWRGDPVELWLGISWEELMRMKESRDKWVKNRWPLIERRATRDSCIKYLKDHGLPVPVKSACIGCPFTDNGRWVDMRDHSPEEWADACDFDEQIRKCRVELKFPVFLHHSLKPLREAPIDSNQMDLWGNECEGHCGL